MELIEVLPPKLNAALRGKRANREKIEQMCRKALDSAVISFIADGSGGTNDGFLKSAIMAIQLIWNEKEEWKAEALASRRAKEEEEGDGRVREEA